MQAISEKREVGDEEDKETVAATVIYTIYDSTCRNCGVDGRYGCNTKVYSTLV